MQKALQQAAYAFKEDEVPVGAVIVYDNKIIAKSYNQVEKLKDVRNDLENNMEELGQELEKVYGGELR